jgi:hypothetical protein
MSDWIDLLSYREFCDVPRMFIVSVGGRTLLFDCAFDDESDEYSPHYLVYELSNLNSDALPDDWTELRHEGSIQIGRIPVHSVLFDETKRRQMKCTEDRDVIAS